MRVGMTTALHYKPLLQQSQKQHARFGNMGVTAIPMVLKVADFATLGKATELMNRIIYGAVIGSRIGFSRSPKEAWENARRDMLGWYFWFMGSPIMQTLMVLGLGLVKPEANKVLISKVDNKAPAPIKFLQFMFNPGRIYTIASDKQIHQRRDQVIRDMIARKASRVEIEGVKKFFGHMANYRALVSFIGLIFTFLSLGIGINLINIALTKAALKREHENATNKSATPMEQPVKQPQSVTPEQLALLQQLLGGSPKTNPAQMAVPGISAMGGNPFYTRIPNPGFAARSQF